MPVIAVLLVWIVNNKKVMVKYKNTLLQNIVGFLIIGLSIFLGVYLSSRELWKLCVVRHHANKVMNLKTYNFESQITSLFFSAMKNIRQSYGF